MKRSLTRRVPFFVTMLTAALIVVGWRSASAGPCISDGQTCRTDQSCCGGVCVKSSKKSFGTCCSSLTTCAAEGANCGMIADGCGGTLDCGTCTLPQTCGGGGTPNVCGCSPTTCAAKGANCGIIADGCGGSLNCGTCTLPQTCGCGGPNVCGVAPACGDGIREVCEQCDGGPYCSATCTLPSLAPGCCQGGIPGCADASGFSLNFYMYQYCVLGLGYTTAVNGGVCSQAGTCDILPLQPVPLCCESNIDGTCSNDGIVSDTGQLWRFINTCEGEFLNRHTVPAATCGPAGTCVPG